jgi:hypothetical protein
MRYINAKCEFLCTVVKGNDCDTGEEIRKIEDVCLGHWDGKKMEIVELSGFVNSQGVSIAELLMDQKFDFANKISENRNEING